LSRNIKFFETAFTYYDSIVKKGGFESKDEIIDFHKKFSHIGFYPFTIIPSIYYGMNEIYYENGIPKIYTNKNYMETMKKTLNEGVRKYSE